MPAMGNIEISRIPFSCFLNCGTQFSAADLEYKDKRRSGDTSHSQEAGSIDCGLLGGNAIIQVSNIIVGWRILCRHTSATLV